MSKVLKPGAKQASWGLQSVAEETKFCPRCGSQDLKFIPEEQGRMVGGEVGCNGCNRNFIVREFVDTEIS